MGLIVSFFRDLGFFLASLILYDLFMLDGIMYFTETFFFAGVCVLYIVVVLQMNKLTERLSKRSEILKNNPN